MKKDAEYWIKILETAPELAPGYLWDIFSNEPSISHDGIATHVAWLTADYQQEIPYYLCAITKGPNAYIKVKVYDVEEGLALLALWTFMGLLN